jgi:Ca-activated chloride channel family protein
MWTRKWLYTALVFIGLATLMPGFLQSQQGEAPGTGTVAAPKEHVVPFDGDEGLSEFRIGVDVNLVSVPVTVRRADGSFFKGLTQNSFRIREDGREQEIVFFAEEALPTHIALVLDISGSVRPEWGTIRRSSKSFLEHLSPDDYFSIITFNDEFRMKMNWGQSTARVDEVLTSIWCNGVTNLWDAIHAVSTQAFDGITGKKVMILMTDGMDNNSMVSYSEAVRAAVENDIAIYIVSITRALQNYLDYVLPQLGTARDQLMFMMQSDMAQGEAFLRRLAHDTGGRVLQSNNFGQLDDIYAEVTEELRNQYTLGYVSTNTARDGSYREISVGVSARDVPNVRITARPGYYAPRN